MEATGTMFRDGDECMWSRYADLTSCSFFRSLGSRPRPTGRIHENAFVIGRKVEKVFIDGDVIRFTASLDGRYR